MPDFSINLSTSDRCKVDPKQAEAAERKNEITGSCFGVVLEAKCTKRRISKSIFGYSPKWFYTDTPPTGINSPTCKAVYQKLNFTADPSLETIRKFVENLKEMGELDSLFAFAGLLAAVPK